MQFKRFRKYRINKLIRDKYAETQLYAKDFIYPYFVVNGNKVKKTIKNFYDVYHLSIDYILKDIENLLKNKINKILLFGVINNKYKNESGSIAYTDTFYNPVPCAIYQIKKHFPEITVFTDVCLCGYTNHGHCGIIKNKKIDNDLTIIKLAEMALLHAQYGVDYVAPSAMMDGQVKTIRETLNKNKFYNVKIMSYSAKYASNFYGPFRIAANSKPLFGDRKSYQMDFRNARQAIDEIKTDINEGADIVMVKPAGFYSDVISKAKQVFKNIKIAAYQVSGEYMMIKLLSKYSLTDEIQGFLESFTCLKRAGADFIISYYAKEIAKWIKN